MKKSVECGYQVVETTFHLNNGLNLFPLVVSLILCVLMCSLHYHGILALAYSIMFLGTVHVIISLYMVF